MTSIRFLFLALVPLAAGCASPQAPASEEVMMSRWTAFMTPGEAHKALDAHVGRWNMTVRMFGGPGAPPQESRGSSRVEWIMDGRFLSDTTEGEFNGMPFHGSGLTGYDNLKGCYVSTWIDNFGTGMMRSEGRYDAATKTFHFESEGPDFAYVNAYVPTRATETWSDADHFVVRAYAPDGEGEEYLSMEFLYERAR